MATGQYKTAGRGTADSAVDDGKSTAGRTDMAAFDDIIGNYLSKQTMMHEGVTNAHVVSSLMLRIDTEMGMGSSGDENAVEFCYFLQNMGENEKQNIDALQLTNVEYEKGLPVKAALNKKLNGR